MDNSAIEPIDITADTPCRSCQYNLRGLRSDALCPECATPVAVSIRDDRLQNANPVWVRKLRRGVLMIVWSMIAVVPGVILTILLRRVLYEFIDLERLGIAFLLLGGMWVATTPDPGGLGEDVYGTLRRVVRVALIVMLINHLTQFPIRIDRYLPPFMGIVMALEVSVASLVGQVALLAYLGKLATRIPDDRITRRGRFLAFAIGICSGLGVLVNGLLLAWLRLIGPPKVPKYILYEVIPTGILGLGTLIFGIMELFMLLRLSKRLRESAALAEQSWREAEHHAPPM